MQNEENSQKNYESLSLYGLTSEICALESLVEENAGEISDEIEEREKQALNLLQHKTDSCVYFVKKLEDEMEAASKRITDLKAFISARENAINRFDEYVKKCLLVSGKESFLGEFCEIKKRKPTKIVAIVNQDSLPVEFVTVEQVVNINKMRIKDALKNGEIVPGALLVDGKESIIFGNKPVSKKKKD